MASSYQNPMLLPKKTCIFCLDDDGTTKIQENTACQCKYNYHATCQGTWDLKQKEQNKPPTCLMCHVPRPSAPPEESAPQHITLIIQEIPVPQERARAIRRTLIGIAAALVISFFLLMFRFWV